MKKHTNTCFHCNTALKIDLQAYKIISIGGKSGVNNRNMENIKDKVVETVKAELCSCPLCGHKERLIGEEVIWLSMQEIFNAIGEGKIISDNPEIELLLKVIEFQTKGQLKLEGSKITSKENSST